MPFIGKVPPPTNRTRPPAHIQNRRHPQCRTPPLLSASSATSDTMLGLDPAGEYLIVNPALPEHIGHLELLDIPGRWRRTDAYGRGRIPIVAQPMA